MRPTYNYYCLDSYIFILAYYFRFGPWNSGSHNRYLVYINPVLMPHSLLYFRYSAIGYGPRLAITLTTAAETLNLHSQFTMSSFTSKLGDEFLRVPKISADGRNWVIYRDRLQLSVQARGLDGHLDGTYYRHQIT